MTPIAGPEAVRQLIREFGPTRTAAGMQRLLAHRGHKCPVHYIKKLAADEGVEFRTNGNR